MASFVQRTQNGKDIWTVGLSLIAPTLIVCQPSGYRNSLIQAFSPARIYITHAVIDFSHTITEQFSDSDRKSHLLEYIFKSQCYVASVNSNSRMKSVRTGGVILWVKTGMCSVQ